MRTIRHWRNGSPSAPRGPLARFGFGAFAPREGRKDSVVNRRLSWFCVALAAMLLMALPARAQEAPAIDHAKRVMDLIVKEQFEAVTKEFNAQMAAALPAPKLQEVWKALLQQTGAFKSMIDERSQTADGGITAVTLGC